nr:hypothetical protein [Actinomycetota bacterium]
RTVWARRVGVTALVLGGLVLLLWYVGSLPHGLILGGLGVLAAGAALTVLNWTVTEHSAQLVGASWFPSRREESIAPSILDYRLLRLRRDLRDTTERSDREDTIYPVLVALVAERLLSVHGVDRDTDRERADALMHPDLVRYLANPPRDTRKRSRRELHTVIERIEEL